MGLAKHLLERERNRHAAGLPALVCQRPDYLYDSNTHYLRFLPISQRRRCFSAGHPAIYTPGHPERIMVLYLRSMAEHWQERYDPDRLPVEMACRNRFCSGSLLLTLFLQSPVLHISTPVGSVDNQRLRLRAHGSQCGD